MIEYPPDDELRTRESCIIRDRNKPGFFDWVPTDCVIVGLGQGGSARVPTECVIYVDSENATEVSEAKEYVREIRQPPPRKSPRQAGNIG